MKDEQKRDKGTYSEVYEIVQDNVNYKVTETTIVGRNFEVMNFVKEYNPSLPFK